MWVWDVLDDGEEFECASVLHHHTQDVKCVRWHPTENVSETVCTLVIKKITLVYSKYTEYIIVID